ncbi:hypothetical protein TcG_02037 [Trypanosoma cruzi]|uniref:Uncharacterized protein n=1 Tax=Trypanosoma cruzi TaxID=5693 RepID=A0A2V2W148_TRYCR|nr:hypothetical protein TcBrA4_0063100 [Trypanosoma cruzi]PWV02350.1 hypothetical protein C4B63_2g70 [Trypanosoma cruzi]RNF22616.1 hypothetical protein TcG_02037 [Trypanosoma cruzi]
MRRLAAVSCGGCLPLLLFYCPNLSAGALFSSVQGKPGHSDDDALGAEDSFKAVEAALKDKQTSKDQALPDEIDPVASAVNQRRNRCKRSIDSIFGDVLHDALRLRDMGHKPDADFVYKRAQERMYEEEYGHKPPSAKDHAAKYVPFPPDLGLNRLIPLEHIIGDDPWPARSITAQNPVWTRQQVEEDRVKHGGAQLKEWEKKMFGPREGFDPCGEFIDAMEELAYWEERFVKFIREAPLPQRRTLPLLHEVYRYITHRLVRAERRYLGTRDAALKKARASSSVYKMTEANIERIRSLYSETHRSLSSPNYDPVRMKKSLTGPLLQMGESEFEEWKNVRKHQRNRLVAEIV